MRKLMILPVLLMLLAVPVQALEIEAPTVPESARQFMPSTQESFSQSLLEVLRDALGYFRPDLKEAAGVCLGVIGAVLITSVVQTLPGTPKKAADLAAAVAVAAVLLQSANSMINLASQTVTEISEY